MILFRNQDVKTTGMRNTLSLKFAETLLLRVLAKTLVMIIIFPVMRTQLIN